MIKESVAKLVNGRDLLYSEAQDAMKEIMSGTATSAQIASFLTALRIKGETITEITAFTKVMKEYCHRIHPRVQGRLVDIVGTGGDTLKTFNVSTTAAFVAAGAGIAVAKHGNRSVTSRCGSADVLENLGLHLDMDPQVAENTVEKVGIGFMFAPTFHPAMKYAVAPRRELGIRTVFNVLGPLTNPADASAQLLGVYDPRLVEPLAHTLKNLDCEEAMVVHGLDGLDEISNVGKTLISWLRAGDIKIMETAPTDFGVQCSNPEDIQGATPEESAEITFKILFGCHDGIDSKRDLVLINGAAGIIVGGKADTLRYGMEVARESIDSGNAYSKLKTLIRTSNGSLVKLEELERKHG